MKMKHLAILISGLTISVAISGQNGEMRFKEAFNKINQPVLKAQLGMIASDWTEGREAGENGELLASDYIASILQLYGIKPGGDYLSIGGSDKLPDNRERTWFQNFNIVKTSPGDPSELKIIASGGQGIKTSSLLYNIDFSTGLVNQDFEVQAPVEFVGYGFRSEKLKYDDFGKKDLKGKFVLKLSGTPGFAEKRLSPQELQSALNESEKFIRSSGAVGIVQIKQSLIVLSQPRSVKKTNQAPSEENPLYGRIWADYSLPDKKSQDTFLSITMSLKSANTIFEGTGFSIDEFIKRSDTGEMVASPDLKGKSIYVKTSVKTEIINARNIIGVIEGKNPDQIIVIGAHYDHLGKGNGYIWNGADDNGSGTAGVMTIAKAITETGIKPDKTIIIALWSAEEMGLLGSRYYVDNLGYPVKNLRLNLNLDMISRYVTDNDQKKVNMIYTDSFPIFRTITEENIRNLGIDLDMNYQPSADPPGGSDHRSFVAMGIPIMRFKPGHREQYHTPGDEIDTLNWDIMEKIVKISFANIWYLANHDW